MEAQSATTVLEKIQQPHSRTCRCARIESIVNAHVREVALGISAAYALITLSLSSIKLLWLDEFITFYIARLGSHVGIWNAIKAGADPNPPLMHMLVMWSM